MLAKRLGFLNKIYFFFVSTKIWAAGALSGAEKRHHSMAGVREQLNGSTRAPGGAYREPRAYVAVRHQRLESLQRVGDTTTSLPDTRSGSSLVITTRLISSTYSNLAFMIEIAQKELQKLRWDNRGLLRFQPDD